MAVNSFGFGGANAHVILESHAQRRATPAAYGAPRLVLASGRTDAAVSELLALAQAHASDAELHALLDAVHALPVAGHARRGFRLLLPDNVDPVQEIAVSNFIESRRGRQGDVLMGTYMYSKVSLLSVIPIIL